MKYILSLCLTISCGFVFGQSAEYISIENKIKNLIQKDLWDDVLLLSPDLVIEEPFRGDGYYYTAMAFMHMGDHAKAETWLAKASSMADEELEKKISDLKKEMEISKNAAVVKSNATGKEASGNISKAADDWYQLWKMDKSKTDYALNAVELFVESEKFEAAMIILEDPIFIKDPASKKIRERINQTPEMKKVNNYRAAMQAGKTNFSNSRYSSAISKFNEALKYKPSDAEASRWRREALDEEAWANTRENNTIADFEKYINGNTLKKHEDRAREILRNSMLKFGKEYAEQGNIERMEYYLNRLKKEYSLKPSDIVEANKILVETYSREAKKLEDSKSPYQLGTAIEYYKKARDIYPGTAYSLAIGKLEKKKLRYGRPDRTYLAYVYDTTTNIGISLGGLKNRKVGVYIAARISPEFFTSGAHYTVNNDGQVEGSAFDVFEFENETRTGQADGIFGFTKKVAYPLWLYAGGGVSVTHEWWKMSKYFDSGEFEETKWVKNTDMTLIEPMAEAGVIIDLSGFHLRGGIKSKDFKNFKEFNYSVGIGFSWK